MILPPELSFLAESISTECHTSSNVNKAATMMSRKEQKGVMIVTNYDKRRGLGLFTKLLFGWALCLLCIIDVRDRR